MNQSSIIFGALVVGFLIYVTIRGRLPAYVALFYKSGPTQSNAIAPPPNLLQNVPGQSMPSMPGQGFYSDPGSGFLTPAQVY